MGGEQPEKKPRMDDAVAAFSLTVDNRGIGIDRWEIMIPVGTTTKSQTIRDLLHGFIHVAIRVSAPLGQR